MNIGIILKVIGSLGSLSQDLKDFEQAAKDLFAGTLSRDEVEKLLSDVAGILSSGIIAIPGVDTAALIAALQSGEAIVSDVISAVGDVKAQGVSAVAPDLKKIASDLLAFVKTGVVTDFGGYSKVQASEMLQGIVNAFPTA